MYPALRKLPDEPGFNRSEQKLPTLRSFTRTGNVLQYPAELGAGEIGVDDKPGLLAYGLAESAALQLVAVFGGASALPYDGIAYRLAGCPVPDYGGLTLVGNADGRHIVGGQPCFFKRSLGNGHLCCKDGLCVVLDPAGLGIDLGKFLLRNAYDMSVFIEQNTAAAGCSGVERHNALL